MDKVCPNVELAVADVFDGATIAIGEFFTAGSPTRLVEALARQGARDLTIVVQSMGVGNWEINLLLENHQVKKAICNYPFFRSASSLRSSRSNCEQERSSVKSIPWGHS